MVVLPYVQGTSEKLHRVFKKHNIATAFKPHSTLRKSLVHPKDKREPTETTGCVYEIGCNNCDFVYVGETGRLLSTRIKEHRKEADKIINKIQTRANRLSSISDQHKSAISDHVAATNHVIDWEGAKLLHREDERYPRWIRESIWIRRREDKAMNNQGGAAFNLSHTSKFCGRSARGKEERESGKREAKQMEPRRGGQRRRK
ncbi:uncharacterized protein [Amphiura filiformis]|uniref:uncharacterized protein n=1 Tax=Amphiura filiformis TaxID=82378 RepID=UPI003B226990